jgi:hypothetical protein
VTRSGEIGGSHGARLLACIRPGQAPIMQDLDDWLPVKTPGPCPGACKTATTAWLPGNEIHLRFSRAWLGGCERTCL